MRGGIVVTRLSECCYLWKLGSECTCVHFTLLFTLYVFEIVQNKKLFIRLVESQ